MSLVLALIVLVVIGVIVFRLWKAKSETSSVAPVQSEPVVVSTVDTVVETAAEPVVVATVEAPVAIPATAKKAKAKTTAKAKTSVKKSKLKVVK
jgi:hypothetical protein